MILVISWIFNSDIIGTFTFKIPGINIEKKITIQKKKIEFYNIYDYFKLHKNLFYYSDNEKIWKRVQKANQIDSKKTYICPYYSWEYKIKYYYYSKRYYIYPLPENYSEIVYISHMVYKDEIKLINGEQQYQRIIGLFNNNWVPLFDTYEKENDLFRLDDVKSLRKYKNNIIFYLSNNYSCSAKELITYNGYGSSLKDIYKTKNNVEYILFWGK